MRRWAPLAAIAALLGAAMLAAVYADPVLGTVPPVSITLTAQAPPTVGEATGDVDVTGTAAAQHAVDIPPWVSLVLTYVCVMVVLAIALVLAWLALRLRVTRRRSFVGAPVGAVPTLEETRADIRGVLDAGLADLDDADLDPRRAVIACWVGLERAATRAGVERSAADTSTDLVSRLLGMHLVVRADVLEGLAELYREARYAPHVVDDSMRAQARSALVELRRELSSALIRRVGGPS